MRNNHPEGGNNMLHMSYLLAFDPTGLHPNTNFTGSQWAAVVIDILLGIGFLFGVVAMARGVVSGGTAAFRGRHHGLGDMGWSFGVGLLTCIVATFFGIFVSAALGLFTL
jgi:hypothetical protein